MKNKTVRLGTVFFLVVAAAVIAAVGTYFYVSGIVNHIGSSQQMYLNLSNVERIVVDNYVNKIDTSKGYTEVQDGIISGYINGLGDPHSYYLNEKNYSVSDKYRSSKTHVESGITAMYDKATECIRVLSVKNGSPAAVAGIKINDVIMRLDGSSIPEIGYKNAVSGLSREPGETCETEILREGSSDFITATLVFNPYTVNTVSHSFLGNGIGYIYISDFDKNTLNMFKDAYTDLKNGNDTYEGIDKLIIDIRNNAAGDFDSMIEVADFILPAATICSKRSRDISKSILYTSNTDSYIDMDTVVLQNMYTSGAAEVFSAALQDNGTAVVIGDTSAGDALGQREIPMSNNTAVILSVYEYMRPSGESFNLKGIVPDFKSHIEDPDFKKFPDVPADEDEQLQYAVAHLLNKSE